MSRSPWTEDNIPSQEGRVAVVTGANSGLGFQTARALASKGAHVVLAVRSTEKGDDAVDRIRSTVPEGQLSVQDLDLASLSSVRQAAGELKESFPSIDLLINNAGVMFPPKQQTEDGFELQFGVDYLGPFALTGLLIGGMLTIPGSRVITVSSLAHRQRAAIHFDDLQWEKSYDPIAAYAQAKLADLLFTYELQHRLEKAGASTIAVAAHPGISSTNLLRYMPDRLQKALPVIGPLFLQPATRGALPSLRAATDPDVFGGQYFGPKGPGGVRGTPTIAASSEQSHDRALQQKLWDVSQRLTGINFPV